MPARNVAVQFVIAGGLNTEKPGGIAIDLNSPQVPVPYLTQADNILFEDTSFRKVGGAIKAPKYEQSFDSNGIVYKALLPTFGQQDNNGDPTEMLSIQSNGDIILHYISDTTPQITVEDDGILTSTELQLPIADGTFPAADNHRISNVDWTATSFEDYLIIASSDTTVGVQLLNGPSHVGTWTQLDPAEPHFAFSEVYQGRLWAAGDPDRPSRLYYSDVNDPTQGYSSNFIDVDPFGAAQITAIKTFRDRLFIFKGPDVGATYVLSGATPSTFALDIFSTSIGCVGARALVEYSNDIMFMDINGHIRTLGTTDKYGDFEGTLVTQGIKERLDAEVHKPELNTANMTNDALNSRIWVQIPVSSNPPTRDGQETTQSSRAASVSYVIDYSQDFKISRCDWTQCNQIIAINTADYAAKNLNKASYLLGISNKYFWQLDVVSQEYIDESTRVFSPEPSTSYFKVAYTAKVELPSIKVFPIFATNNISKLCVTNQAIAKQHTTESEPFDPTIYATFKWQRDLNDIESVNLSQTFGSRLGDFTYDGTELTLNTSRLGGPLSVESYAELETTDFRRVTFSFEQGGLGEGLHVHSFAVTIAQDDTGNTENLI